MEKDPEAQIYNELEGKIKLFFEKRSLKFLGGFVIGIEAQNLVSIMETWYKFSLTAHQIRLLSSQHPTTAESLLKAVRSIF